MVILTVYLEVKTRPIPNAIKITLARNSSNANNVDIIVGETYNGTTFRGSFAYEVQ